jgi:hypothetical protein
LKLKYEKILTKEAYDELILYIDNIYNLFSKPSKITQKIFDKVYENKFGKKRPINNYLNINDLEDKLKIGFLPENDINEIYYINNNFGTKKKTSKFTTTSPKISIIIILKIISSKKKFTITTTSQTQIIKTTQTSTAKIKNLA